MAQTANGPTPAPPQNIEAEQALLGCCLIDAGACRRALGIVREHDFYPDVHRTVFRAIAEVAGRNEPVDLITVSNILRGQSLLENIGGTPYLTALVNEVPTAAHVLRYAGIVAELAMLREIIEYTQRVAHEAYTPGAELPTVLESAQRRWQDLTARYLPQGQARHTTAGALRATIAGTRWLWEGWIPRGYLSALIGDKGKGKSMLALWLAAATMREVFWPDETWSDEPEDVLWIDTEGRQGLLVERIAQWGIDDGHIHLPGADGMAAPTLDTVEGRATLVGIVADIRPALVVIDSVSGGHGMDENSSAIRVFLKALSEEVARAYDCAVLAVHHMGKPQVVPGQPRRRTEGSMADARGSNAFEQFAVSGMVLDRPNPREDVQRFRVDISNLCDPPPALGFARDEHGWPLFCDPPEPPQTISEVDKARTFLREFLSRGARTALEIENAAARHHHNLNRAALRAAIRPARNWPGLKVLADGGTEYWGLPEAGGYGAWALPIA